MVRPCAVTGCTAKDTSILSHRFPRDRTQAEQWQKALNLTDRSIEELLARFVVCTKHFEATDYRNSISSCVNKSAVPQLNPKQTREILTKWRADPLPGRPFYTPESQKISVVITAHDPEPLDCDEQQSSLLNDTNCLVETAFPICKDNSEYHSDYGVDAMRFEIVADEERMQLAKLTHDELVEELIIARATIKSLETKMQLHHLAHPKLENVMTILE